uniref:Uncharacterized protein n=1 Tax=Anopheles atroparvus TaxID=41427 RepID=A0AAG5DQS2_ANOAO
MLGRGPCLLVIGREAHGNIWRRSLLASLQCAAWPNRQHAPRGFSPFPVLVVLLTPSAALASSICCVLPLLYISLFVFFFFHFTILHIV